MKEKEFGYKVSKDYEKLWKMLNRRNEKTTFFIFVDNTINLLGSNITYRVNGEVYFDAILMCMINGEPCDLPGDKDKFIENSKSVNLTFIDPEPENPNAIYYADGQAVCNGDYVGIPNGHLSGYSRRKIVIERGCVCVLIYEGTDHEKHTPVRYDNCIKWDGNRMTNVRKVEE